MEYWNLCGGWHTGGECPMRLESSVYELALCDLALGAEQDPWGNDGFPY